MWINWWIAQTDWQVVGLKTLDASHADVVAIADHSQVLPDYKNNPRIANRDEIYDILMASYERI